MICPNCQQDRHPQEFNHGNQCDYCWSEQARQRRTTHNRRTRAHIEATYGQDPNDGSVQRDSQGRLIPQQQQTGCCGCIIVIAFVFVGGWIVSTIFETLANL